MGRLSRMAVFAVALCTAPLLAQPQGKGPGQGGPGQGGPPQGPPPGPPPLIMLLSQKSVQTELKLTTQQMQKLGDVLTKQNAAMRTIAPADRMTKMKDLMDSSDKAVGDILQADQKQRLNQISLQVQGAKAYSDPAVVKELDLTMDQLQQIGAIEDTMRGQMGPPPQGGQQGKGPPQQGGQQGKGPPQGGQQGKGPPPQGGQQGGQQGKGPPNGDMRKTEANKDAEEKIQKLLTDEQKAKWKELVGKPFTGDLRLGPPGGMGGMPPPR